MGGFDAGAAVERLDYDFTTATGPDGKPYVDAKGTIPEPTSADVDTLFDALRNVAKTAGLEAAATADAPEDVARALMAADDDALTEMSTGMLAAVAGVCKGHPKREEIAALPYRLQQAFIAWVLEELTDPTVPRPATRPSPVGRNGAALST